MSEETRLAKFEVILEEVQKWLDSSSGMSSVVSVANAMLMAMKPTAGGRIDENYKNFTFRYGDSAWNPSFLDKYNSNPYSVMTRKIAGYGIVTSDMVPKTKVIDIIKMYRRDL